MIFSLDVMRALKGDCLMVHYGTKQDPHLIMIDGGPSQVYGPHLRPRIMQIRETRGLTGMDPLPVDLMMVSHVDDDHIQGILDLTKEMITAEKTGELQPVQVLSFWHNSFENIIDNTPDELTAAFTSQFGAASMGGSPPSDMTVQADHADEETIVSSLKVLASILQGAQLRSDINKLDFPLNPEFDEKLILAEENTEALDMGDGLKFTVVGPMLPELKKLHKKHQDWLKALKKEGKTAEDALSAYIDDSVPNLSSIVVLAECGGKRMLLTGDARGDKVLKGLKMVGLIEDGGKMHVDILKVPHHGSSANLDNDFFERITADHYVFSGDGEHGNPERASLEMLQKARGDSDYLIHLTYPIDELDVGREKYWKIEQGKEKKKKLTKPSQIVRPDWSFETNSLQAFFDKHDGLEDKVRIVEEGEPHIINLLDEVET